MNDDAGIDYFALDISDEEFSKLQELVVSETGILLNPSKKELVRNRLRPLLQKRKLPSYGAYYDWLKANRHDEELHDLIQSITTNKTEFFRNERHFAFFRKRLIPLLTGLVDSGKTYTVRIWSAGCSTGEEAYSIALDCIAGAPSRYRPHFRIVASDIDRTVLERARSGIFESARLDKVPRRMVERYFRNTGDGRYRTAAVLRSMIEFTEVNLIDEDTWPEPPMDVIFCRNVLIYMRADMKRAIINGFHRVLKPGGYLFLGHSETMHGIEAEFRYVEPSIYKKYTTE